MRLGRPIATATRHVPRWVLASLLLAVLLLLATRTRRSSAPRVSPAGPAPVADPPPAPAPRASPAGPAPEPEPASEPATDPSDAPDRRTRQELYAEAQRLGIPGRSKMRRDELARAIADWTS